MPEIVAENIDQIISFEIRPRGMPRGKAQRLYQAARKDAGEPLVLRAAQGLISAVDRGDRVFITCMTGGPPWLPNGETDGPPGGAAIASVLAQALGVVPFFVVSDSHRGPVIGAANAVGLPVMQPDWALARPGAAGIVAFPADPRRADDAAARVFDEYEPAALIAVETLGPNVEGVVQSVTGHDMTAVIPGYYALFDLAAERGVYTVGIGDGGNEIGFGRIREAVEEIQDFGAEGQVPGRAGMATRVATDALIFAGVSNWGASGLAAMLAFLTGRPKTFHAPSDERRMIEASAAAGAVDGRFARTTVTVDGLESDVSRGVVAILGSLIRVAGEEVSRPF